LLINRNKKAIFIPLKKYIFIVVLGLIGYFTAKVIIYSELAIKNG